MKFTKVVTPPDIRFLCQGCHQSYSTGPGHRAGDGQDAYFDEDGIPFVSYYCHRCAEFYTATKRIDYAVMVEEQGVITPRQIVTAFTTERWREAIAFEFELKRAQSRTIRRIWIQEHVRVRQEATHTA